MVIFWQSNFVPFSTLQFSSLTCRHMTCRNQCQLWWSEGMLECPTIAPAICPSTILGPAHTHTHPFNGPLSGTTQVSRYQKGKTNLDFTEARDSGWQWHQLAICMSAPRSRQTTTPAPHHSYVFYGPDALPAAQPRRASGHSGASSSENSQHPWYSCKNSDMISLIGVIMDIVVHVLNCYKVVA